MNPIECMKKIETNPIPSAIIHSRVSEILNTEDESTTVSFRNVSEENLYGLVLILSNEKEGYDQVHYFCADRIDLKNNEYNYFSCSVAEVKAIYRVINEVVL